MTQKIKRRREVIQGFKDALPIVFGYVPVGFAYGVLAKDIGLGTVEIVLMSILVYAGSGQFIAVGLLGAGAPAITIIFTTFLVNLRHLLMSASLVPFIRHFNAKFFPFVAFGITDESYGVALGRFSRHGASPGYMLALNLTSQSAWVLSSLLGAIFGTLVEEPDALGLNFALPAMFIALLVFQLKDKLTYLVAVFAGLISIIIILMVPGNWNIIIATIVAATIGTLLQGLLNKIN